MVLGVFIMCGLLFIQNLMNLLHYKRIYGQYKNICSSSHYQSVGNYKGFFKKRYAVIGFSEDGIVEECWLLNGYTIFAKFNRVDKYDGMTCQQVIDSVNPKNKDERAILQAAQYMELRKENAANDAEYFAKKEEPLLQQDQQNKETENTTENNEN